MFNPNLKHQVILHELLTYYISYKGIYHIYSLHTIYVHCTMYNMLIFWITLKPDQKKIDYLQLLYWEVIWEVIFPKAPKVH